MDVKTESWRTPNFIILNLPAVDGEKPKISIKDATEEALSEQCDRFRAHVFERAGKTDPNKG